jgi:hypothetical protein
VFSSQAFHSIANTSTSNQDFLIVRFRHDLNEVLQVMHVEMQRRHLWDDAVFAGRHLGPLIADLLNASTLYKDGNISATQEMFRLAAVLYVNDIRGKFGMDQISAGPLYARKLMTLTSQSADTFHDQTIIWVLAVAYSSQCIAQDQRNCFTEPFLQSLQGNHVTNIDVLLGLLDRVVWDVEISGIQTETLRFFFQSVP